MDMNKELSRRHSSVKIDLDTRLDEDDEDRREWQERGTTLGICATVGALCGSHLFYLSAMFGMIKANSDRLLQCREGEAGLGKIGVYVCDYTKAYIECFPELALTICILVVGRNLLQLRMYYGLLQRGAVLQYKSKSFFSDNLVRFFLWCYVHCLAHLGLILYLIHQHGANDELTGEFKNRGERAGQKHSDEQFFLGMKQPPSVAVRDPDSVLNQQINMLVELVGFFVVPATLFLVYLCLSYDIEIMLVPLSQYFYDARQAYIKKCEITGIGKWSAEARCTLTVLDDNALKLLVEDNQNAIHDVAENVTDAFDHVIDLYKGGLGQTYENRVKTEGKEFTGLSFAHWPCRLLVSEDATTASSGGFCAVYVVFTCLSVLAQLFMMVSLGYLVYIDVHYILDTSHLHSLVHLAVVLSNIAVEIWGIYVNSSTVVQWFAHDMLRNRDGKEKNWNVSKLEDAPESAEPALEADNKVGGGIAKA